MAKKAEIKKVEVKKEVTSYRYTLDPTSVSCVHDPDGNTYTICAEYSGDTVEATKEEIIALRLILNKMHDAGDLK